MQQQGGRRDGVARKDHLLEPRGPLSGEQSPGERFGAAHGAVDARRYGRRAHHVPGAVLRHLGRLPEGVARVQCRHVGLCDLGPAGELFLQPVERDQAVAPVHPQHQPERPHVATAMCLAGVEPEALDRLQRLLRDVELQHLVGSERAVVERVGREPRLGEVPLGEGARVHDHRAADPQVLQIDLERRGIHRDEHVHLVAGRHHVHGAEMNLERRDAVGRARGGTDLGRVVGEGREVVAGERRLDHETAARHLHPVARVTGEPDDHGVARFTRGVGRARGHLQEN